jgi:hypothetical protein
MLNLVRERKEVTFSFSNGTNLFMVKGKKTFSKGKQETNMPRKHNE